MGVDSCVCVEARGHASVVLPFDVFVLSYEAGLRFNKYVLKRLLVTLFYVYMCERLFVCIPRMFMSSGTPEEGVESLRAGVTGGCEPLCGRPRTEPGLLCKNNACS